jgi:hypothetical protein
MWRFLLIVGLELCNRAKCSYATYGSAEAVGHMVMVFQAAPESYEMSVLRVASLKYYAASNS